MRKRRRVFARVSSSERAICSACLFIVLFRPAESFVRPRGGRYYNSRLLKQRENPTNASCSEHRARRAPFDSKAGRRRVRGRLRGRRATRSHGRAKISVAEILLRPAWLATLRGHLPSARILFDARRSGSLLAP